MKFITLFTTSSYLVLASNGANASFLGLKGKWCEYTNDQQCGRDKYCQAAVGDCLLKTATIDGNCQQPPAVCTMDSDPVCGCDGKWFAFSSTSQKFYLSYLCLVVMQSRQNIR